MISELTTKWLDPDFRNEAKSDHRCVVCGKAMRRGRPFRTVLASVDGPAAFMAIHPAEYHAAPASALVLPIGPECAEAFGLEWTVQA